MKTEIEAKFLNIDKDIIRKKLKDGGATLLCPEFDQKRVNFHLPKEKKSDNAWLRVRDEGNKITMSLKAVAGDKILDQKEISFKIDNFESAVSLLEHIGCEKKAYTFTKRETWNIGDTEITIDTWPFFETFIEIEGPTEKSVTEVARKLGLDFEKAVFGSVGRLYKNKYGISLDEIEREVGDIAFDNKKMQVLLENILKK